MSPSFRQGAEWEKLHSVVNPVLTSPKFISGITQASDEMALDFVKLLRKSGPHFPSVQSVLTKFVVESEPTSQKPLTSN